MTFFVPFWGIWFALAIICFIFAGIVFKNISKSGSVTVDFYDPIGMFILGILLTAALAFAGIGFYVLVIK